MCGILISFLRQLPSPERRGLHPSPSERLLSFLEDVGFIKGFGCLWVSKESGLRSWLYCPLRLSLPSRDKAAGPITGPLC